MFLLKMRQFLLLDIMPSPSSSSSSTLILLLLMCICNSSCYGVASAADATDGRNIVSIANDILYFSYELDRRWLNTGIRPCQDFYGYVCGKSFNGSETQLSTEHLRSTQRKKFDEFLSMENDEQLMDAELKLKQFYLSCKDARSMDDLKSTLMYRNTGGWPAIDDAATMIRKRRNMTWMDVIGAFHEAGFEYFFKSRIEIKSNKRIVHLEPDTTMRFTLRKFEQLASEVLEQSGVETQRGRLVELEIMNFERNRRDIAKSEIVDGANEYLYGTFKTAYFGNNIQLQWDSYFKKVLGKTPRINDTVIVRQMPKMVQYFELLQNTSLSRLLNWIWLDYLMDKRITDCQIITRHYFESVYQHIVERAVVNKVEMAQMYANVGRAYEQMLPNSSWIDEMSQEQTKLFLGRVMHLTLNGDSQLDNDLIDLTITKRNFYRNLEKMQRHLRQKSHLEELNPHSNTYGINEAANDFMKIFLTIGSLLQQQNLTTPLNYILVGEYFAKYMIASGSSSKTPGAWRSMDSEHEFAIFKQCLIQQNAGAGGGGGGDLESNEQYSNYNLNDLLLRILSQQQTLHALDAWRANNEALWRRLDRLLTAGRLQLTLRKLFYIGALLTECHHYKSSDGGGGHNGSEQRQFVHSYLRNSLDFTQTFSCRPDDELYARNICKVL